MGKKKKRRDLEFWVAAEDGEHVRIRYSAKDRPWCFLAEVKDKDGAMRFDLRKRDSEGYERFVRHRCDETYLKLCGHEVAISKVLDEKGLWRVTLDHWRRNVELAERGELDIDDISGDECAFCIVHYADVHSCAKCPIRVVTGKAGCHGTSWWWLNHVLSKKDDWKEIAKAARSVLIDLKAVRRVRKHACFGVKKETEPDAKE